MDIIVSTLVLLVTIICAYQVSYSIQITEIYNNNSNNNKHFIKIKIQNPINLRFRHLTQFTLHRKKKKNKKQKISKTNNNNPFL